MKVIASIIGFSLISGHLTAAVAQQAQKQYLPERPPTAVEKKAIQAAVADKMKDPGSVQIKWTQIRPNAADGGVTTYCATYNAKNGYGGYMGFHPLLVGIILKNGSPPEAQMITTPGHTQDVSDGAALQVCRARGLDPYGK